MVIKTTGDSNATSLTSTNYLGSDCSGTNPNKTLDVGSTPRIVVLERNTLRPTTDYTVSGTTLTFNISIQDFMRLTVWT